MASMLKRVEMNSFVFKWKRVVRVLSPSASKSCGRSHFSFPCHLHVCLYVNEDNNIIFLFPMWSTCLYVAFLLEGRIIMLAVHGQFPLITMHWLVNGWNPEVLLWCGSYSLIVLVRVVLKKKLLTTGCTLLNTNNVVTKCLLLASCIF